MPAVKKPKTNKIKEKVIPSKSADKSNDVVSGQLKSKLKKAKPEPKQHMERGVVLVKHLPHGFFEQQLRQYFKQFGNVTRLRLARSERTGGSKCFAFVEFEYPEVAKVAAETMDNYLMFQKVVKATYIPPEKQHFNFFKTSVKKVKNKAGKDIYVSNLTKSIQNSVKKQNNWDEAACQKRTLASMKKIRRMQKKYEGLGIDVSNLIVAPVKQSEASTSKKDKSEQKELELADLLGNTINDDSDDEDYVDGSDEDVSEQENTQVTDDSEGEEEVPAPRPAPKKQKKTSAADCLGDLTKRKPGTGAVQKKKKTVSEAKVPKSAASKKLQLAAAKQLAKPLQKKVGKKEKK